MALTTSPITGSFTGTADSDHFATRTIVDNTGTIAVQIYGTFVATIVLQRSNDAGSTWRDVVGESYTAPQDFDVNANTPEFVYRLSCSAFTSGEAFFVIAQ